MVSHYTNAATNHSSILSSCFLYIESLQSSVATSCHRVAWGTILLHGYTKRTMMISVPGAWDSYRPEKLHRQLEPAYAVKQLVINLAGARHVTDTLLAELLELRNHREHRGLEAALIVVNWPFVRNLLELSGFDRLFRVFDSIELPARESLVPLPARTPGPQF